jgi:NusA-like KH domain protein
MYQLSECYQKKENPRANKKMGGAKLDFRAIQYLNLFSKLTGTRSSNCFNYADFIIFEVPRFMMSKAIGEHGANIKKLSSIIKKKIKVIPVSSDVEEFIQAVVYPVNFKKIVNANDELTIFAGSQSKALLIGRGNSRLNELKEILKTHFNIKKLKIF